MAVLSKLVMKVELRTGAQTEYGTPQPVVVVEFDEQMHWRAGQAFLHWVAAEIELRSIPERWIVQLGAIGSQGRKRPQRAVVKLELADGTQEEAERAVTVLQAVVQEIRGQDQVARLGRGQ